MRDAVDPAVRSRFEQPLPRPFGPRDRFFVKIRGSSTLRTAAVYAAAGVAFAAANLLLARTLSYQEYGLFALAIAVLNLTVPLASFGADGLLNRQRVQAGPSLFRHCLFTTATAAVLAAGLARGAYEMPWPYVVVLPLTILAGGVNFLAGAHFQSRQSFRISLILVQGTNFALLLAAGVTVLAGLRSAWLALALLIVWYVVAAAFGWRRILGEPRAAAPRVEPYPWAEAGSIVGVTAVTILLGQMERLLIPKLLDLESLALFGVLAATVGSIFRILLLGVGFAMVPKLRATQTLAARRRLVAHEAIAVGAATLTASVLIWFLVPPLVEWMVDGKYVLSAGLVLASLVTGCVKVVSSFARSVVVALGSARELARLNVQGWVAIAVAVVGAAFGAGWGVTGVIYGVGIGWTAQALCALILAVPHLRSPTPPAAGTGVA